MGEDFVHRWPVRRILGVMTARAWLILAVLACVSCGTTRAGGSTRAPSQVPDGSGADASTEPAGMLAAESVPAGLEPLSRTELALLEVECGRITAQVQAPAQSMPAGPDAMLAMLDVLDGLRSDESRTDCLDLAERDIKNQLAGMIDREAMRTLEWLTGKLHQRLSRGDDLCPSAAPVPSSLEAVRNGPPSIDRSEWERAGWEKDGEACLDSDWRELAKRFQVELQTDLAQRTSKLIARGYPVVGGEPSELFVVIRATEAGPEISEVMRVGGVPKPVGDEADE
jgi:hypothetical protein